GQLTDLLKANLGFALRNDAANEYAGLCLLELVLDLCRNTHSLEQTDHVNTARAGGIANRLRREQSLLERFSGPNVWLRCASPHPDPNTRLGEIDTAAGHDLAAFDVLIDRRPRHDQEIVGFTRCQPLVGVKRTGEHRGDLMPGRLLELRH